MYARCLLSILFQISFFQNVFLSFIAFLTPSLYQSVLLLLPSGQLYPKTSAVTFIALYLVPKLILYCCNPFVLIYASPITSYFTFDMSFSNLMSSLIDLCEIWSLVLSNAYLPHNPWGRLFSWCGIVDWFSYPPGVVSHLFIVTFNFSCN